jgi:hypothetical protein
MGLKNFLAEICRKFFTAASRNTLPDKGIKAFPPIPSPINAYIPGGGGKKGPINIEKDRPDPPEGTFGAGIYQGR